MKAIMIYLILLVFIAGSSGCANTGQFHNCNKTKKTLKKRQNKLSSLHTKKYVRR